jgi:hypothetical protein
VKYYVYQNNINRTDYSVFFCIVIVFNQRLGFFTDDHSVMVENCYIKEYGNSFMKVRWGKNRDEFGGKAVNFWVNIK